MGRKKNPETKTREEDIQEKLAEARRIRLAAHEARLKEKRAEEEGSLREQFRIFWASNRKFYNKNKDLEAVLWLHLKAIKHDKPELFEAGLANFGLKK